MVEKIGMVPGSLIHVGEKKAEEFSVYLTEYNGQDYFLGSSIDNLEDSASLFDSGHISWIDVVGLHEVERIKQIGKMLGIHSLLLEDILNTHQRPKAESSDANLFLSFKMLHWNDRDDQLEVDQLSLIVSASYVVTFQEQETDIFSKLRQRIRSRKGRVYQRGADYLAYSILDVVVDHYFLVLEKLEDKIELLEEDLLVSPTPETLQQIHKLKKEILFAQKAVWPLQELLRGLERGDFDLFEQETLIYLRDVYEHSMRVVDTLDTLRELSNTMVDIYLTSVNNKMNDVMRVLTIVATIFIPLTFITSLYGMNFRYMPELQWRGGYLMTWLVMLVIGGGMVVYFKKKQWL